MKKRIVKKWLPTTLATACSFAVSHVALADFATQLKTILPGSTLPGVAGSFMPSANGKPIKSAPKISAPEEKQSSLGPKAAQLKFKLVHIVLEGNHIYSDQEIEELYKDKINTVINVVELQEIVQSITNYYRNNGYILSRAVLPPQHVRDGIVHIRILEGFIDEVRVVGTPKGARKILQAYGNQINKSRPLQIKVMEKYLRIANEVPGLQARAVLEPSKTQTGASDLDLVAQEKTINASLSYDNYGTRYIGPQQVTANLALNSIFTSGDATRLVYATTATRKQLNFYDASYQWFVGDNGLSFTIGKNRSVTQPGFVLSPLNIFGEAVTYYGNFAYPLIRTRDQNLSLDGGFSYLDSSVSSLGQLLYFDHIRSIKFGANYSFADRFRGSNLFGLHLEKGLPWMNASTNTQSVTTSRFGGTADFLKFMAQAARVQQLFGRYSLYLLATGQYSFNPLLASSQFSVGGSQIGRGYDPAEIIGDRGLGGTVELRMDIAPGWKLLQSMQPYIYYDAGVIWNIRNIVNVEQKASITSTGIGSRFVFNQYFTGNLMWTQPLTRQVAAEQIIGRGENPRVFFSLVGSV